MSTPLTPTHPDPLTHEVRELLANSLEHMAAALDAIQDEPNAVPSPVGPTRSDLLRRLRAAERTLQTMTRRIERFAAQCMDVAPANPQHGATLIDTVGRAIRIYAPAAVERDIGLYATVDPEVGPLPAGPLYTALASAINNALHAIETRGPSTRHHRIDIQLYRDARGVVLQVSDTGCGLEPAFTSGDSHGIGLGLCRQVAEQLHGTMTLLPSDPDHPGKGATFTLSHPLAGEPALRLAA